ncbi:basement membrane-specific heparan sulfate proteoglycan core protein [Menidia menidia]
MHGSVFLLVVGLSFCPGESGGIPLESPYLSGPSEALVKKAVEFRCEIPNPRNQSILLRLFKRGEREDLFGEYTLLAGEEVAVIPKSIKRVHEGFLVCVASLQNNTQQINSSVSNVHFLKVIEPVTEAKIVPSGSLEFYEGERAYLRCELRTGNHVDFRWLKDGRLIPPSPVHSFEDDRFIISRTSSGDSGSYVCVATNSFNNTSFFTTNSSTVFITVKDLVSNPEISYKVQKEPAENDSLSNYSALVTCQSARGALPVVMQLFNGSQVIGNGTGGRSATFRLPLVLDRPSGSLRCRGDNGGGEAYSPWMPLEVVRVGGPVTVRVEYDVAEDFSVVGLRLFCSVGRGSHPRFRWFLNRTALPGRGSFHHVFQGPDRSILLLSVGGGAPGTYHCQVADSFDNSTVLQSPGRYLDKEVLNRLPDFVVAVVFGCFTALVLLVSFCCLLGVVTRRGPYEEKPELILEMDNVLDILDWADYSEDPDVTKAAAEDGFDQASGASVDEWPLIELEKRTLEDETPPEEV